MDFKMEGCWIENHPEYNRGFEAGQQSKQEEIENLKTEIGGLKKRINRALELLNEFNCPQEYGVEDVWKASSILTGENNE